MQLTYSDYLDKIYGGWLGKCIGGMIGTRFEGQKQWIDITPDTLFPDKIPANDDLDLQVLWLKVLEERGPALTSDDLAQAWLDHCWYPFNEYGIFRRNYRLGIAPPYSGRYGNDFWETGMGCPIRSEIWGYAFPGAPDLAAQFAQCDGTLDHTDESVGAEKMFAAMASLAFFIPDVRRLTELCIHHLPVGSTIHRLVREAFACHDAGLSLLDARQRLLVLGGNPEACDARNSVPFTFLGLLYGGNDLEKTMITALNCGYDTDCTLATAGALIGQILGAKRIPPHLTQPIGDKLVMGIQYQRPEMTVSALARDTARVGALLTSALTTGTHITDMPTLPPFPATALSPQTSLRIQYETPGTTPGSTPGTPGIVPGQAAVVTVHVAGIIASGATLTIDAPAGWTISPPTQPVSDVQRKARFTLTPDARFNPWPTHHRFTARLRSTSGADIASKSFGLAGEALWMLLGVFFDPRPTENATWEQPRAGTQHHYVDLDRPYLPEDGSLDVPIQFRQWSRILGKPAIIPSVGLNEIPVTDHVGLQGEYCVYLARKVISPDPRPIHILVGNNDAFRVWVNGKPIMQSNAVTTWAPFNHVIKAELVQGENLIVVKLIKRTDHLRFSLGLRAGKGYVNCEDWLIDLAEVNPLTLL